MNSNIKDLEKTLWAAADKMRGGVSVTNYKFLILGIIFGIWLIGSGVIKFLDKY